MNTDDLNMGVCTSPKPQKQHSGSTPSKGSQRCISIHAAGDDASSGFLEPGKGQAHAVEPICTQSTNMQAPQGSCGVVYDAVMELHIREGHPEHPNRIKQLSSRLEREGLLGRCTRLTPKLATDDELLKCHSRAHIDRVDGLYSNPTTTEGKPAEQVGDTFIISGDIYCNRHTSTAARSAAGCCVQAVRAVMSGQVRTAFAIVRPPGHHAESQELQGFCFFNNVAVAAHAALEWPGVERVLILDWDIHHGNGTQQIFTEDPRVLFVSLHRRDGKFYPQGCGYAEEVGKGAGRGFNVNVPWTSKGMGDADYLAAFDLLLDPIIAQFDPQLVLISAGFDAADGDFLGCCRVSPAGFAAMTQRLQRHAGGKVVAVLEGGYVPSLVGECAAAVMTVLQGDAPLPLPKPAALELHKFTRGVLSKVDKIQSRHWSALAALPKFEQRFKQYSLELDMQRLSVDGGSVRAGGSGGGGSPPRTTRAATRAAAAAGVAAVGGSEQQQAAAGGGGAANLAAAPGVAERAAKAKAAAAARKAASAAAKAAAGATSIAGPAAALPAAGRHACAADAVLAELAAAAVPEAAAVVVQAAAEHDAPAPEAPQLEAPAAAAVVQAAAEQGAPAAAAQLEAPAAVAAPSAAATEPGAAALVVPAPAAPAVQGPVAAAAEPEAPAPAAPAAPAAEGPTPAPAAPAAAQQEAPILAAPAAAPAIKGTVASVAAAAADGLARLMRAFSTSSDGAAAAAPDKASAAERAAGSGPAAAAAAAGASQMPAAAARAALIPVVPATARPPPQQQQQVQKPGEISCAAAPVAVAALQPAAVSHIARVQATLGFAAAAAAAAVPADALEAADAVAAASGTPVPLMNAAEAAEAAAAAGMLQAPSTPPPTAEAAAAAAGSVRSAGSPARRGRKASSQQQQQQPGAGAVTPQQQQQGQPGSPSSPSRGSGITTRSATKQQQQPSPVAAPAASPAHASSLSPAAAAAEEPGPAAATSNNAEHVLGGSATTAAGRQPQEEASSADELAAHTAELAAWGAELAALSAAAAVMDVIPGGGDGAGETAAKPRLLDDVMAAAAMALPDDD